MTHTPPFALFAPPVSTPSELRWAITDATRREEAACMAPLLRIARLPQVERDAIRTTAIKLVEGLRARGRGGAVEALVKEYSLSSHEGVALMCLAEALLRIPDDGTRDALIRDKIARGQWREHLSGQKSVFVNAATWGLVITGKLYGGKDGSYDDLGMAATLNRLLARAGEPMVRQAVDLAMRMMGEQFVTGQTIAKALKRAKEREAKGFRYSYDMLGEAAVTHTDAERYYADYENAIHAIGKASAGRGIYEGPGISIKLSALHPRYSRAQVGRVMDEMLPRVKALAVLARDYDIGLNIDAEEADRLELSLDLLESLAFDPELAGWDGLGFVVQAYGKRCPMVIDWIVDLATRARRRIMVRLVKGAYWDAEIKRAQVDGLASFPVYTRKVHTDVAYIACARRLLAAREQVFPQFATHNAQTLATIYHLAGTDFAVGDYEFQCLHGMGEPLYSQVVGKEKLDRPCRVYAPVGTHETLLAYLVRRLLENGANSSFVNRIGDPAVPVDDLVADPVEVAFEMPHPGSRHELIARPDGIYPDRLNSSGIDLADESALTALSEGLVASTQHEWRAGEGDAPRDVINPADHRDIVGQVCEASSDQVSAALERAAASTWGHVPVAERAAILERAADAMQQAMPTFMGLAIREAGKSAANAVAEVREAIDFMRYYAQAARDSFGPEQVPLGPVVCISPWNFPLAIFSGQVCAALVAGNPVLAKPAEQTPLIAAEAVRLLHAAGVPDDALQLVAGAGDVGAALVGSDAVAAVMFTGSTEVARLIQKQLAERFSPQGLPIPLIAETGGQNAMIVDSSALAEQVVADVIASAFDSAGQRCSALRVLCVQEDVADRTLAMLQGALDELSVGKPDRLAVDIGPVIDAEAQANIVAHIEAMRARGHAVRQLVLGESCARGTFVAPTVIEIDSIDQLGREVFGPVLHVLRYARKDLDALIDAINATGYGLTFGLHTRMDGIVAHVMARVKAGNLYVNRNTIGAIVGVQPFGGRGLSGTGPKAGGPLYLGRLVQEAPQVLPSVRQLSAPIEAFASWLDARDDHDGAAQARKLGRSSALGLDMTLPGPVGERNTYSLHARGHLLLRPQTQQGLFTMLASALASGNSVTVESMDLPGNLPSAVTAALQARCGEPASACLVEGGEDAVLQACRDMAARPGPIVTVHATERVGPGLAWLLEEQSLSVNTTAAGGNASLMMIG